MPGLEPRALAEWHLAASMPSRWAHVSAVARTADEIAARLDVDRHLVVAAAWLHDIGYSPSLAKSGFHALDGARYLRDEGYPPDVVNLVAHHSGAVVEAEERGLREQLLTEFPFARSLTMDVLWYCDMTTGPDGEKLLVEERLAEIRARYGPSDVVTRFVERAEPELVAAVRRVEHRLDAGQSK